MAKRKRREDRGRPARDNASRGESAKISDGPSTRSDPALAPALRATDTVRRFMSFLVVAHFLALILTLSSNLGPSYVQGELGRWAAPYLVTTNQKYVALPLALTHADTIDFPLWIELRPSGSGPDAWQRFDLPGSSSGRGEASLTRSRWPNFSRMVRLVAEEQPDSELLAEIAAQVVRAAEARQEARFDQVRFVQPHVLSFDEDAIVDQGQASLIAQELEDEVVFTANVVRDSRGDIGLVPMQESSRTSKPLSSGGEVSP